MEFVRLDFDDDGRDGSLGGEGPSSWLDATPIEPPPRPTRKRSAASSILMAAMLGLVDALGWERPKDETVEVADAPIGNDGLVLDYRHLEPLE